MLISVGSKNPVKVRAVVEATRNVWPHVDVVAVEISGGVSEQPTSDREAITGAAYRAQMSLDGTDADMGVGLDAISPRRPEYQHGEGNSPAHLKSSLVGVSQSVLISGGKLVLGTWQGVYLAEFDGPRRRKVMVKVMAG